MTTTATITLTDAAQRRGETLLPDMERSAVDAIAEAIEIRLAQEDLDDLSIMLGCTGYFLGKTSVFQEDIAWDVSQGLGEFEPDTRDIDLTEVFTDSPTSFEDAVYDYVQRLARRAADGINWLA